MKVALLGAGKTGSFVPKVIGGDDTVTIFDSLNKPSLDSLKGYDVMISFLPGDTFVEYTPLLMAVGIPVVTGSTGFDWPKDMSEILRRKKLRWIHGNNFSLGMNVVRNMVEALSKISNIVDDSKFRIQEIHHKDKKDAPSGTALSMKKWLDCDVEIESERVDDVVGIHSLRFDSLEERITLEHEAKDRSIFAKGAVWAAKMLLNDMTIPYGLNSFDDVVRSHLRM